MLVLQVCRCTRTIDWERTVASRSFQFHPHVMAQLLASRRLRMPQGHGGEDAGKASCSRRRGTTGSSVEDGFWERQRRTSSAESPALGFPFSTAQGS